MKYINTWFTKILDGYGLLKCKLESSRRAFFLFTQKIPIEKLTGGDVVVALEPISKNSATELSKKNVYWLDLKTKTSWINREDRWALWVRGFLVRYGIRVELIRE